jgi:parvulin-like peptidyl-prolyl isomerase
MSMKKMLITGVIVGLCVSLSYGAEEDPVYGKAGNYVIRKSDLDRILRFYPPDQQKMFQENPNQKIGMVQRLLQVRMVSDLAKKEGLDKKPEIKEQLQYLSDTFLEQEYMIRAIGKEAVVTDEEVKRFYDANEKGFLAPEQVRARHILIRVPSDASGEERKKAREKIDGVGGRIKKGEDFARLAAELSEDTNSQMNGGDLGYFTKGQMAKPFEEAAFSLKPGEVSGVVETQFGYHLIKVEDHQEARMVTFDAVKEQIRGRLRGEANRLKGEELIRKIARDTGMEIYPDKIVGK